MGAPVKKGLEFMSDAVIKASKELNNIILESEEYKRFSLYKKELAAMPELKEAVQEYRKKNFEIARSENPQKKTELLYDNKNLLENPIVASYLNAELSLCKMIQNVTANICRNIDLELEFLKLE